MTLSPLTSALVHKILRFAILPCILLLSAKAQNPYAGNYSGFFYVQNTGVVNLPETGLGVFIATIDNSGAIRNGINVVAGPSIGSVNSSGVVTFTPALAGSQISKGTISKNTIHATNTLDFGALKQVYRLEAARTGDVIGSGGGGTTLDPAPVINALTPSQELNPGTPLSLSVQATPATSFQWYRGAVGSGVAINGATQFFYNGPAITEAGTYYVEVTNGSTKTISEPIHIAIKADPGAPWSKIQLPLADAAIRGVHGDVWVCSTVSAVAPNDACYISNDRGKTWDLVMEQESITAVYLDDDLRLYVARNALLYQNDAGAYVRASITPFPGNIGKIVRLNNGDLFFPSLQAEGIFRSQDNGRTWERTPLEGLPFTIAFEKMQWDDLYLWPEGNRLLCGIQTRSAENVGAIYYSDDSANSWQKGTWPTVDVSGPTSFGRIDGKLYSVARSVLYVSEDNGVNWTKVKDASFAQVDTPVDNHLFYWSVNKQLTSMGADLAETDHADWVNGYPIQSTLYYSAPDLIANFFGYGWFSIPVGEVPTNHPGGGVTPTEPRLETPPTPVLNATTGTYDQALTFQNFGTAPLKAFEVEIRGLPDSVSILNASRRLYGAVLANGQRHIDGYVISYLQEVLSQVKLNFNIQYTVPGGGTLPTFTPTFTLNTNVTEVQSTLPRMQTRLLNRAQAAFGYPVIPGKHYQFRWSANLTQWDILADFVAAGHTWEWLEALQQQGRYFQLHEVE